MKNEQHIWIKSATNAAYHRGKARVLVCAIYRS